MKRLVLLFCVTAFLTGIETEDRIKPRAGQDKHPAHNIPRKNYIRKRQYFSTPKPKHSRDTIALIDENFETGMPVDWTVVDGNSDGHTWTTGTTFDLLYVEPPNYGTAYAYYSDDDAGTSAPAGTEYLISPAASCAGAQSLALTYSWGFNATENPYGATCVRFYEDTMWANWNLMAFHIFLGNGDTTIDLSSYLPAESVQIQYTYEDFDGILGGAFGVDNVLLEAEIPTFYVWDFETGWQGWTRTGMYSFPNGWGVEPFPFHASYACPTPGDSSVWFDDDGAGSAAPPLQDTALSPELMPNPGMQWLKWGVGYNYLGTPEFLEVGIKYFNGLTWSTTALRTYTTDIMPGIWDSVDISSYSTYDLVQVYFYYDDGGGWMWFGTFDNVSLDATVYAAEHDIGVTRILSPPMGGVPAGDYDFIARIQNLGDFSETGDISAVIWDTVGMVQIFSQTYTLANFPPGGDTAIDFGATITVPNYYYCEVLAGFGDDNPANDTLTVNSYVPESLGQRIYWIDAQTPTGSIALQGVEYDGSYFYLTGATAINETKVFVLDTLGDLVWTIDQPAHCTGWGWRDMAFDRVYVGPDRIDTLYASCDYNVDRFGINKVNGTLDYYGPLPGPTNPNRSLAYMPESLYFFTADMFHIFKFIKNGSFVYMVQTPCQMRGAAYDSDTIGGGTVWWSTADELMPPFMQFNPNTMSFTGVNFSCEYAHLGLGFAQDFRDMDVLFSIVNTPQADYIYGFFLRWSDSTGVVENSVSSVQPDFGFAPPTANPIRTGRPISFVLPYSCKVRLNAYDATGRLVRSLVNNTQAAGSHVTVWDGRDNAHRSLASGVYFLKLEAGARQDIRKIVFLE
jgi:hypothetical protein